MSNTWYQFESLRNLFIDAKNFSFSDTIIFEFSSHFVFKRADVLYIEYWGNEGEEVRLWGWCFTVSEGFMVGIVS